MLNKFGFEKSRKIENKSENQQKLETARKEVEKMVDKLGLGVDENIKEVVAIFRAMGFPTESSCGGHTGENGKNDYGFPYIRVYAPAPEGWSKDKRNLELDEEWQEENLKYRNLITPLLEEFERERKDKRELILQIRDVGRFGAFDLNCKIEKQELKQINTEKELIEVIRNCQNEMNLFTNFLKDKFLDSTN